MMPHHDPRAIANEFLKLQGSEPFLTHMQIQKLVYFAYGWNLAVTGHPLTSERPEAWDNGPVFPSIWDALKHKGKAVIAKLIREGDGNPFTDDGKVVSANLTDRERSVIERVWRKYSDLDAFAMSDITHRPGTPWGAAYYGIGRNARLDNDVIEDHYRKLALAGRKQ